MIRWAVVIALFAGPALPLAAAEPQRKGGETMAGVEKRPFGKMPDGTSVDLYILTNKNGMQVKAITYGGIITEMLVPDRDGKRGDVVLGFDNLDSYLAGHPYFGAIVGRVGNRIAKGQFTLDGKEYTLAKNNGPNS